MSQVCVRFELVCMPTDLNMGYPIPLLIRMRVCVRDSRVCVCVCDSTGLTASVLVYLLPALVARRDRIVVSTLRCGRSNPGSNPGHGIANTMSRHKG